MNSEHTCLFKKGFCTVDFGYRKENAFTLPHSAQRKQAFLVRRNENNKSNKYNLKKRLL